MGPIARSGTWDEASSPAATRLARRFEDAWRDPRRGRNERPDPADFLPEGGIATPGAWLALLETDLNLRWDDGDEVRVEEYRDRYPGLDAEVLVALCYEEYCRRKEDGRAPFPSEYDERFPGLSERLRRLFDIHDLFGYASSTDLHAPGPEAIPFPEARQTIAGFHLVEELGRGAFARVFLARERQLADRPVALKVARTGSREPQTLARLQHTHIVPVHSYRTDPATGLHLLCMPFFGRVTLGRLLADPSARAARSGADLLATLDRLGGESSESVANSVGSVGTKEAGSGKVRSAEPTETYRPATSPPSSPLPPGEGPGVRVAAEPARERIRGASGNATTLTPGPSPGGRGEEDRRPRLWGMTTGSRVRSNFASLPFDRAIAWWGARLAEALAHAHDRGVLHRDIKPSNVLVTGDGLPMLLDFNLAGEPWADREAFEPDHLGGTLAYMAPEHLEAVAIGEDDRLDARADVYSLGVLLFEALTGSRPFPPPSGQTMPEALRRAAEARRGEPPRIRDSHPEVPAPMERVIRRCLEPDPARRFPNAGELADDLQAVADDAPLKWTREPIAVRAVRWARRSWKKGLLVALVAGSAVGLAMSTLREENDRARVASTASKLLVEGKQLLGRDEFATALARFEEVIRLTSGRPELLELRLQATVQAHKARETEQVRARADAFSRGASKLRFRLIGAEGPVEDAESELVALLAPFRVLVDPNWARNAELTFLDSPRRLRLTREVDEVLFLFASGFDPRDARASRRGLVICERALTTADDTRPWLALRDWLGDLPMAPIGDDPKTGKSAKSCYETGLLLDRMGRGPASRAWLSRACELEPDRSWYHYHLATLLARGGDAEGSIPQYQSALAVEPRNRRYRLDKAKALRSIGEWAQAEEDEARAGAIVAPGILP